MIIFYDQEYILLQTDHFKEKVYLLSLLGGKYLFLVREARSKSSESKFRRKNLTNIITWIAVSYRFNGNYNIKNRYNTAKIYELPLERFILQFY